MQSGRMYHKYDSQGGIVGFKWKIPQLLLSPKCWRNNYYSPRINVFGEYWNIDLFQIQLSTTMKLWRCGNGAACRFAVGIKERDGSEKVLKCDQQFPEDKKYLILHDVLCVSDLRKRRQGMTAWDVVTFTVTFSNVPYNVGGKLFTSHEIQTEVEPETATKSLDAKGYPTLHKNMKALLHTSDDHDLILKVKRREFRVHMNILRARSPAFATLLRFRKKETTLGTVCIDDCDPDAFEELLNYVYTGKVDDLSLSKAIELYCTSEKYGTSELKEACVDHMKASLSVSGICDVIRLSRSNGESELLECAINFFSRNTKEVLGSKEWQKFVKKNFVVANELYIKAYEAK